jgi:hypothetical protein
MNELLLTLAEEIRQTMIWLGQEEEPSKSNIRFRLRTLREAASMARMNAVEAVLADLDTRLVESDQADPATGPIGLEDVLGRLSSLLVSLAEPAEARELAWVAQVGGIEEDLRLRAEGIGNSAELLRQLTTKTDRAVLTTNEQQRAELSIELGRELRQEADRLRDHQHQLHAITEHLSNAARTLIRELTAAHRIPLDPTFARLRERVRRWARSKARPVSLQCRTTRLDVGVRQYDPLVRVLDALIDGLLESGQTDPEQRRKAGKPTVASIVISGKREGSLLELCIEDDGSADRPGPLLADRTQADLQRLRAAIWRDARIDAGLRLVLRLPIWYSSLEALPILTAVGEVLVPLSVVEQILGGGRQMTDMLPIIDLERRSRQESHESSGPGLVCAVSSWRAWLPGRVIGPVTRVVARPATQTDPTWVLGHVLDDQTERPLLHPLPFVPPKEGLNRLYPLEADP